ncbi:MAG: HAD hydrolase-like protein [Akkermansiaceae bacterium]|nr:HAD hydrolase-like protein [Akkermansiaceae bacterium]MCF7731620.1 HAD hydrolase-like protein [Akkermansiaceae bacterium]
MFNNIIFDWSGTLVDDLGPVLEATNAVLSRYGVAPLDREGFRRRFRLPYREFYAEVLPAVPLEELEDHFRLAFAAAITQVTVLPHAREKLDWCAASGIRVFVLTSMDAATFREQLEQFGFGHYFEATYAGVLDKREVIHQILQTHGLDPAETAFVGDMTHDIETARHGGISSVAVLTGYQHSEVLAAVRPDLTVPDLKVLRELLGRRRKNRRNREETSDRPGDTIEIRRLQLVTHIGVPEAERACAQTLWATIRMAPAAGFRELEDNLARTVDYHQAALEIERLATARPRHLIETLAVEIAEFLLGQYPLAWVAVTLEKKILPQTECVAVHVERHRRS